MMIRRLNHSSKTKKHPAACWRLSSTKTSTTSIETSSSSWQSTLSGLRSALRFGMTLILGYSSPLSLRYNTFWMNWIRSSSVSASKSTITRSNTWVQPLRVALVRRESLTSAKSPERRHVVRITHYLGSGYDDKSRLSSLKSTMINLVFNKIFNPIKATYL